MIGRPLLWLCTAFGAGVVAGLQEAAYGRPWWSAIGVCLLVAAVCRGRGRLALSAGLVIAFSGGALRSGGAVAAWEAEPLRRWVDRPVVVEGTIAAPPEPRASGGERLDLAVAWLFDGDRPLAVRGLARLRSERASGLALGDRIQTRVTFSAGRTAGNPGQFSEQAWLRRDGAAVTAPLTAPVRLLGRGQAGRLARCSAWLRGRLCGAVRRTMPGPAAAVHADLLNAMVFGSYAAPVDPLHTTAFRRAGVSHVLVASGTQVSLILAALLLLSRNAFVPPAASLSLAVLLVGAYTLVTGGQASIVRADVMGLLVLGAAAAGHDDDLPTNLAFAAALLLLYEPLVVLDIGFQYSFAATAGLIFLGVPLLALAGQHLPKWLQALAAIPAMTLGAQLFVLPLTIIHFREVSLAGLPANLPVIPWSGVLVVTGLAAAMVGQVSAAAAGALNWVNHELLRVFLTVVWWFARQPWAVWSPVVLTPSQIGLGIASVGGACLMVSATSRAWFTRQRLTLVAVAAAAAGMVWLAWSGTSRGLQVTAFDVGEGDAILVRGPGGRSLLVDGGPRTEFDGQVRDAGRERVVPALALMGVRRLEAVVGTHPHNDHLGGLVSVVQAYPPGRLLLPPAAEQSPIAEPLRTMAAQHRVSRATLVRGDRFDLGGGALAEVLWPPRDLVAAASPNNTSVVLRLTYRQVSFLLTGDLEAAGEEWLRRCGDQLAATVLKVGHQGSRSSTSAAFLAAVQPRFAVISCGPNSYGHPAEDTLRRLAEQGTTVHRTDQHGMVTYRTDGYTVNVQCYGRR